MHLTTSPSSLHRASGQPEKHSALRHGLPDERAFQVQCYLPTGWADENQRPRYVDPALRPGHGQHATTIRHHRSPMPQDQHPPANCQANQP